MAAQQLEILPQQVLRQAQHERNTNLLRQHPFVLSLSKHLFKETSEFSRILHK